MKKSIKNLVWLILLFCFQILVSNCGRTNEAKSPLGKALDSVDIKEHLLALYPDVQWGMTTSSTTNENGKYTSLIFHIECPEDFLTKHPDAKEVLKQDILKKYPEIKSIPIEFNFGLPATNDFNTDDGE